MTAETWKPIEGYEGLYEISNYGNIKSLKFKDRNKTLSKDKDGYLAVCLWKNNSQKRFRVHRLVAEAFIPNPNNFPIINHKDETPNNNHVENLEWCTVGYNNVYGNKLSKIRKSILQYTITGVFVKKWNSISEAGRYYGVNTNIINVCRGTRKTAYGYIWRYEND